MDKPLPGICFFIVLLLIPNIRNLLLSLFESFLTAIVEDFGLFLLSCVIVVIALKRK